MKKQARTKRSIINGGHLRRSAFRKYHSEGLTEPILCLALFCFIGPLRKGVNASGTRLMAVAGGGPRWVIWHGVGLNRIVALKA